MDADEPAKLKPIFPSMPMTQLELMISGLLCDSMDPEIVEIRQNSRHFIREFNKTEDMSYLKMLFGKIGSNVNIEAPFRCEFGKFIEIGDNFYAASNCVFLDCNYIKIGDNVTLGAMVNMFGVNHPIDPLERGLGGEVTHPIVIGNNVKIGPGVVICPGVSIGENSVIAPGSVVVKNIPAGVFAAGSPCKPQFVLET